MDRTRVRLKEDSEDEGSDYINANYVKVTRTHRRPSTQVPGETPLAGCFFELVLTLLLPPASCLLPPVFFWVTPFVLTPTGHQGPRIHCRSGATQGDLRRLLAYGVGAEVQRDCDVDQAGGKRAGNPLLPPPLPPCSTLCTLLAPFLLCPAQPAQTVCCCVRWMYAGQMLPILAGPQEAQDLWRPAGAAGGQAQGQRARRAHHGGVQLKGE